MSRRLVRIGLMSFVTSVAMVSAIVSVRAQAPNGPRKGYQLLRAFSDRFTCEYPAKDWDVVGGGASSIVTLAQKKHEAAIVVEYQPMQLELAPSEIDDNFAKLEAEPIATHQSEVSGLTARILDVNSHRAVVIEYSRRGAMGPEQVRQYSLPIGKHLYRVIGSAPKAMFERYAPTFEVVALSFVVTGVPPAAPAPPATPKS